MGYETDLKLFIDGVWKSADAGHTVVNPVDAKPIGEVPYATKADLEEALAASDHDDLGPFERLLEAVRHPYEETSASAPFAEPAPADVTAGYQTFCGT